MRIQPMHPPAVATVKPFQLRSDWLSSLSTYGKVHYYTVRVPNDFIMDNVDHPSNPYSYWKRLLANWVKVLNQLSLIQTTARHDQQLKQALAAAAWQAQHDRRTKPRRHDHADEEKNKEKKRRAEEAASEKSRLIVLDTAKVDAAFRLVADRNTDLEQRQEAYILARHTFVVALALVLASQLNMDHAQSHVLAFILVQTFERMMSISFEAIKSGAQVAELGFEKIGDEFVLTAAHVRNVLSETIDSAEQITEDVVNNICHETQNGLHTLRNAAVAIAHSAEALAVAVEYAEREMLSFQEKHDMRPEGISPPVMGAPVEWKVPTPSASAVPTGQQTAARTTSGGYQSPTPFRTNPLTPTFYPQGTEARAQKLAQFEKERERLQQEAQRAGSSAGYSSRRI